MKNLVAKIVRYAKLGTLLSAVLEKTGIREKRQQVDADHYHGEVAREYLKKRLQQKSWHVEQSIMEELLSDLPDEWTVLDVPFGTGRFVDMYSRKRMQVFGLDISADMLAGAKEELGDQFKQCRIQLGSAHSLPYPGRRFDLIVCFRFFGLISLDMGRTVLSEFQRVAKHLVIIRVPIRKDSAPAPPPLTGSESVQGNFYEREIIELFGQYGFRVRETRLIEEKREVLVNVYVLESIESSTSSA